MLTYFLCVHTCVPRSGTSSHDENTNKSETKYSHKEFFFSPVFINQDKWSVNVLPTDDNMKEGHVFFLFFFVHRLVSRWHVISNPLISDVYLINLGRAQWMAHLCICSDITHPETHIQNAQHAGLHVHVDTHAHAHRFVCKSPQINVSTQAESSSFFFFLSRLLELFGKDFLCRDTLCERLSESAYLRRAIKRFCST